jgi:hypothetical protein
MISALRSFWLFLLILTLAQTAPNQQQKEVTIEVTITEPATYELAQLYKSADKVALVQIRSGDAENYKIAVYKGVVVKGYKGTTDGEIIYFGPYIGQKIGSEYILFLRNVAQPLVPTSASGLNYGTVHYSEVFDEGFSSMETSYECVFDGKTTAENCDVGVRICTDYIRLPKSTRTFPPTTDDPPFGCRWVRKRAFVSLLETISGTLF